MSARADEVRRGARRAADRGWLEPAARAGLIAKAALYAIMGALALTVAVGGGGETTDQSGALSTLVDEPFGKLLVGVLAVGLLGYGLWRLVQAIFDTGGEGDDAKGVVTRIGYLGSAVIHLALFAFAIRLLTDSGGSQSGGSSGSGQEQQATSGVFGWTGGRAIVVVAALVIIGVGAYQGYRGVTKKFMEDLNVSGAARRTVERLGIAGHVARGAVFALVGVFLMKAAIEYDPKEAEGLDGALARLAEQPFGAVLLGITAVGLLAYAAYCVADARFRSSARV